jgi:hypothetical protein
MIHDLSSQKGRDGYVEGLKTQSTKQIKRLQKARAKDELMLSILKVINTFESKEEPDIVLTNNDIVNVLSSIIVSKTKQL